MFTLERGEVLFTLEGKSYWGGVTVFTGISAGVAVSSVNHQYIKNPIILLRRERERENIITIFNVLSV